MDPVCFHIGARLVYWYGVMVAAGFLACLAHLTALGIREKRGSSYGSDVAFWIMLFGIIGARVAYVAANAQYYLQKPMDVIRVDQGGLIYYGGFIGAFAAGIVYARIKKISIPALADFVVSALPLGHFSGRIGCFLNGCCYGTATGLPWGTCQHGATRHPVQIYEALLNLGLYLALIAAYRRKKRDGQVLAVYLVAYPPGRFLLEFLRGDERLGWHGLDYAQAVSLALFAAGLILAWFVFGARRQRHS